jgi:hypothetical protein
MGFPKLMKEEPKGAKHIWVPCQFESGPQLWRCVLCDETSYHNIPDAKGCKPKGEKP